MRGIAMQIESRSPLRKIKRIFEKLQNQAQSPSARQTLRKGMTLVELAIVILVIGILMAILYSAIDFGITDDAKKLRINASAKQLQILVQKYESEVGPLGENADLSVLSQKTDNWRGVDEDMVKDPWGHPYYFCNDDSGQRQICTHGEDGVVGGEGKKADFAITNRSTWPQWMGRGQGNGNQGP